MGAWPMADREKLVIVGGGMAALRLLEELDARGGATLFNATVIAAETQPAFNRILLSPMLAGEKAWDDVQLQPAAWYAERSIDLRLGDAATALDSAAKTVTLASGAVVAFDRCVLATGSAPILLPIPRSEERRVGKGGDSTR